MPISKYYKGHGEEVMSSMRSKYGDEKGTRIFYATANKKHMKPNEHERPSMNAMRTLAHGA